MTQKQLQTKYHITFVYKRSFRFFSTLFSTTSFNFMKQSDVANTVIPTNECISVGFHTLNDEAQIYGEERN